MRYTKQYRWLTLKNNSYIEATWDIRRSPESFRNLEADAHMIYYLTCCRELLSHEQRLIAKSSIGINPR